MSKNVQNRNLMGSLKRGVKMFLMRSINIKNMTFYNYPLHRCRKKRWKPRLKMTFFGHFYEFWLTIWLIRLMRRFEFALKKYLINVHLTKISKNVTKTFIKNGRCIILMSQLIRLMRYLNKKMSKNRTFETRISKKSKNF